MNLPFALLKDRLVQVVCVCIVSILSLTGCEPGRTATVFGLSQGISDTTTDPEQLNRELEDTLRESELRRLEKLQAPPKPKPRE